MGEITQRDCLLVVQVRDLFGDPGSVRPLLKAWHRFIGNTATGYIRSQGGHPAT
jgi:hypothetical protein